MPLFETFSFETKVNNLKNPTPKTPVKVFHYFCQYLTGTQNISHIKISVEKVVPGNLFFDSFLFKSKTDEDEDPIFFLWVSWLERKIDKAVFQY